MENSFFGHPGSLQDSHVDAGSSERCYDLRGLTFILNLSFAQRWGRINLDWRFFIDIAGCSYLKVEESFVRFYQAIVNIDFESSCSKDSSKHQVVLSHDRLRQYSIALQKCSHPFGWSRNHHLVLSDDQYCSYSAGSCFSSGCYW